MRTFAEVFAGIAGDMVSEHVGDVLRQQARDEERSLTETARRIVLAPYRG